MAARIAMYRKAYLDGRITWKEYQGFLEAIAAVYGD